MSDVRRARLELPGGDAIEYLETGDGQPLVYFHGAGGGFPKAAFLSDLGRTFRVLAPSRPGYDGSSGTCFSARDEGDVMAAFLRQVADGPVHLVAESAGAASACWLTILHPEMVSDLVLVAPTAFASHSPAHGPGRSPADIERVLFGSTPEWISPLTEADAQQRQRNAAANAARIRPANGNQDLLERLHEIDVPTLILWATADRLAPLADGQIYQQRIAGSQRILIYGAAHSLPVAAREPFVRLTREFIERGEAFIVNPTPA
jgi:pimeloyl-ACP methyl ester carboxylesterase